MAPTAIRRRWRWIAPAVVVLAVAVVTAQAPASSQATSGNEQQVKQAQQQMLQAALKGDKDEVGRFLTDDVSWVDPNGQVLDKQAVLDMTPPPVRSVEADHVKVMGATAIVTGTAHRNDGSSGRFLQHWVNRDGQWKLTAHEATAVTTGESAATGGGATGQPAGTSGSSSVAPPTTVSPTLSNAEERAVWEAQIDIVDAYAKGDVDKYSQLTSDDFMRIEIGGKFYTKREWLDNVRKNASQPVKPGAMSNARIRVDNDVATVTLQVTGFNKDGSTQPPERQTRIFAKRNGQWQQVAAIATTVSQ